MWSTGEGNGNPLQCSCLQNPRDGGAWWAAVYGVAQSRTRLKRLSSSSSSSSNCYRGQGRRLRGATPRPRSGGCAGGAGGPRGATPRSRSGGAAVRRYPSSKVRSSGCALLEQPLKDTLIQGNRNPSKMVGVVRGIRGQTHKP